MKKMRLAGVHTPKKVTRFMFKALGVNLEQYDYNSNAYLATIEEHITGPVWVMDLYLGKLTYRAVLEEVESQLYIYVGGMRPVPIIDLEQEWKRKIMRRGVEVCQVGKVYSNKKLEPCFRWEDKEI